VEGVTVLFVLPDSLPETLEVSRLAQSLVANATAPRVVTDLSGLDHIRSSVLSGLVFLRQRLNEVQGRIVLCGLLPLVWEAFARTRIDTLFEIYETTDEALRSLRPRTNSERWPHSARDDHERSNPLLSGRDGRRSRASTGCGGRVSQALPF
jgi:stage II sporulation protein AA (anti-sigma F factor antagonist)